MAFPQSPTSYSSGNSGESSQDFPIRKSIRIQYELLCILSQRDKRDSSTAFYGINIKPHRLAAKALGSPIKHLIKVFNFILAQGCQKLPPKDVYPFST